MIYLFFDLETTGFREVTDRVIEIAAAAVDMNTHKIIETYQTFVNPEIDIPAKITEITSITNDMVKNGATEIRAFEGFADFLEKHNPVKICGHNIDAFDMRWVKNRNERYDLNMDLSVETLDTLKLVREIAKEGKLIGYNFETATGRPSYRLELLMKYFELGDQNHRAIDDVLNNVKVYLKLMDLKNDSSSLGF